jgi:hypothetical protein
MWARKPIFFKKCLANVKHKGYNTKMLSTVTQLNMIKNPAEGIPCVAVLSSLGRCIEGSSMKKIPLTQGQFALVDDADYDWLMQWKWSSLKRKTGLFYAVRTDTQNKMVYMHRSINDTDGGFWTDHVNGNGLDNRRLNLRTCSKQQNAYNRRKTERETSSRYKGVSLYKRNHTNPWMARIKYDGKSLHIGYYPTEADAARAYDIKALEMFGKYASVNFPERIEDEI